MSENQERDAASLAQAQLEAYNRKDLKSFCDCYASDVQVETLGAESPDLEGKLALFTRYQEFFSREPKVHCEVTRRLQLGNFVIDQETLTGFENGSSKQAIAIYEAKRGEISRVWFIR